MLDKELTYVVIGVSSDQRKYGYQVFKDLLDSGYNVKAVNPKRISILNQTVFSSVIDIIPQPDVIIFVVPPVTTLKILKEIKDLDIKQVWFQPGSESLEVIKYCQAEHIKYIANACIMVKRKEKN